MIAPRLRVAVPVPLYTAFDYRLPAGSRAAAGARVRVPFGARQLIGVVLGEAEARAEAEAGYRVKTVTEVLDDAEPLLPAALLELALWLADYYHHPIGEVLATMLPGPLRRGEPVSIRRPRRIALTPRGQAQRGALPRTARTQRAVLDALAEGALSRQALQTLLPGLGLGPSLRRLLQLEWLEERDEAVAAGAPSVREPLPEPTPGQAATVAALQEALAARAFAVHVLQGVTGSGKTEVYLRAMADVLARGGQVLALVPEIGLTPQLLERVRRRFGADAVAGFHSGLSEAERAQVWLRARSGEIAVVVGTRSAAFLPLPQLALIVVDEEHDASLKQQEGLRYSARDLAVLRGQREQACVVLGSATPSLETLQHVESGRYRLLHLPRRVRDCAPPRLQLLDVRAQPLDHGLSAALLAAVRRHLDAGGQVLLFINRRGYAPALLCHACGWIAPCRHCDARLTWHRRRGRLICHHCGAQQALPKACPQCASNALMPVGQGTERVEEALRAHFPEARCERFDSDRLRNTRALQALLDDTREGRVDILVGTQMLAKGHDFAGLSLVGIVDADQALYSADFRALERMGQLLTQVAGRAGRAERPGEVLMQTHQPDHPALRCLIEQGYEALARQQLAERRLAGLPPFAHLALLRAEAPQDADATAFLTRAREQLPEQPGLQVLGPVPAPMERRAGRYRAQLLLQSASRATLQRTLKHWITQLDALKPARGLRWSIDVDPVDLY